MTVDPDATRTPTPDVTTALGGRALIALLPPVAQPRRAVMVPRRAATATVVRAATRNATAHRAVTTGEPTIVRPVAGEAFRSAVVPVVSALIDRVMIVLGTTILRSPKRSRRRTWPALRAMS